jgi:diaminopimelate decarboxylase
MEYQIAERVGFKNIIFNGPIKKEGILHHALDSKSIVNLDSEYEIESVIRYRQANPDISLGVGLRINVMLSDSKGNSNIQCGLKTGRFGFSSDNLAWSIKRLRDYNIKIISLHGPYIIY